MYDVLILVLEQSKAIEFKKKGINILALNEKSADRSKYFFQGWACINNMSGILYKVFPDENLGIYECGDDLFEFGKSDIREKNIPYFLCDYVPFEIIQEEYELNSISIVDDYEKEFSALVNNFIEGSPIKTIIFLCYGQSIGTEIILGKITKQLFLQMLKEGKVYTNICYVIGDENDV